jgi:hypothetical protein
MIIIIPLLLDYHYLIKFEYDSSLILYISISTSLYSYQLIRYPGESGLIKKSSINFLGIKKEYINIKEKDEQIISSSLKKTKAEEKKKEKKNKIKDIKEKFNTGAALASKENLEHIFFFIIELLKELKPDKFSLFLNLSFSDPYYNGLILGYYYSFKEILKLENFKIKVDWFEPKFKTDSTIEGEVIPIKILFTVFKFIFSIQSIRLLVEFIKNKKKNRRAKKLFEFQS